jgi:hypothetical protein
MRMLDYRFAGEVPRRMAAPMRSADARSALLDFQRDACDRLAAIIARRRGAVLADSVGLGKTHVATALIRAAASDGRRILVTAPSALTAHWRRHLRGVAGWRWASHAAMSRGGGGLMPPQDRSFIVVDEAHAFRNPASRRYRHLARLCRDADVLLVSATPVNNGIFDFYHLLRLFACDDAFADTGVPDMLVAFEMAAATARDEDVRRIVDAVVVRRTRRFVEREYGAQAVFHSGRGGRDGRERAAVHGHAQPQLRFPRTEPVCTIRYDAASCAVTDYELLDGIAALRFPVHAMAGPSAASELMRLGLLKRLESSRTAFAASIDRLIALVERFIGAAARGYLFDATDRQVFGIDPAGARQLTLDEVALRPWPREHDRRQSLAAARAERDRLADLRDRLRTDATDPKAAGLGKLVTDTHPGERVLVFSEFRETAEYLCRTLAPLGGVGLVHGSDARLGRGSATRASVIRRFAPLSNGAPEPRPHQVVRVLIATDVLSEGLNLQDAGVVVSYDVPWNPVRLAQRIGRIDRLGSLHESVRAYAFLPDRGLDALLGLMRRVRRKLRHIRIVGGDAPSLSREAAAHSEHAGRRQVGLADEAAEALRLAHARHRRPDGDGVPQDRLPLLGAMQWQGTRRAALCCVTRGSACWLLLVPTNDVADERDRVLLNALSVTESGTVAADHAFARRAATKAAAEVRSRITHVAPVAVRGPSRWAAGAVHRWLAGRPGGASQADCVSADELLHRLGSALPVAVERDIARIAVERADPEDIIARLRILLAACGAEPSTRAPDGAGVKVRAVLELLPAQPHCLDDS